MKITRWLIFVALLYAVFGAGCKKVESYEKPLTPVKVKAVEQQFVSSGGARYSANIQPNTQVDLAFKVGGLFTGEQARSIEVPDIEWTLSSLWTAVPDLFRWVLSLGDTLLIVDGQSQRALEACDVTLIASGTATLEAALYKRPMVIAYNMNWLSWQLMRYRNLQPWVGLPNILCREFVVPELLQDAATPQALAAAVLDWMDSPEKTLALQQRFAALHQELRRDTTRLATDAIEKILAR